MPLKSPVGDLLFNQPLGKKGKPIFGSQTDLVTSIVSAEGSEWKGKNFKSVRAFVNQVVNGERKLSEKLKEAIALVLPDRLGDQHDPQQILLKIERSLDDFFQEKKRYKQQAYTTPFRHAEDAHDFYLLEKRGLLADTVLVTARQSMVVNNGKWSNEIKQQMLQKVGLVPSEKDQLKPASYTYFYPTPKGISDNKAFQFWKNIYDSVKYKYGQPNPEKLLKDCNREGRILVFTAPELLCSYPIVIYDLGSLSEVGFTVFGYADKGQEKISTARISPNFLQWWKETVYAQLIEDDSNPSIQSVLFEDILSDILRNEEI